MGKRKDSTMAKDDMHVVIYKILTYLYQCLKEGVEPNVYQAQKICGINPVYWNAVVDDCIDKGYIKVPIKSPFAETYTNLRITSDGVEYLDDAKPMNKVKHVIGETFEVVLKSAIEVTRLC